MEKAVLLARYWQAREGEKDAERRLYRIQASITVDGRAYRERRESEGSCLRDDQNASLSSRKRPGLMIKEPARRDGVWCRKKSNVAGEWRQPRLQVRCVTTSGW